MVLVHVKHFLDEEGILFFPRWFRNISSVLNKQKGFISIKYGQDRKDISCMNIFLEFEDEEKLTTWGKSDLHNAEVSKLDPYRTKPYEATRIVIVSFFKDNDLDSENWLCS